MTTTTGTLVLRASARRRVAFGPGIALAMTVLLFLLVCAVAPQLVALSGPNEQDLRSALAPPVWNDGGSWTHPLGTDTLGRDVYSRLVFGTRVSLGISLATALLAGLLGVLAGLAAGYFGGRVDRIIMGWCDVQQGAPAILILMVLILSLGTKPSVIVVALGVTSWMIFARVVRTRVLTLRESSFIDSSVVIGASTARILGRHVLPHLIPTMVSLVTLQVARILLVESGLSFLGIGIQPPLVSWGLVLGSGRDLLAVAYWVCTVAGVVISMTVISLTVFARWIVPVLDKSSSQTASH